ncbi:hypothetical protein V6N13_092762 [Hibiscus sabdariffa]|uniref:Uncharacterized protein n=1 Tax=Hibiscus sabdariffa TaxID=183260 RepID=A0ABR2BAX1_9ROSI
MTQTELSSTPAVEPQSSNLSSSNLDTEVRSVSPSNLFFSFSPLSKKSHRLVSFFHGEGGQSSASFFEDNSVSLGKLMGFRQRERGSIRYFQNTIRAEQRNWRPPAVAVTGDGRLSGEDY